MVVEVHFLRLSSCCVSSPVIAMSKPAAPIVITGLGTKSGSSQSIAEASLKTGIVQIRKTMGQYGKNSIDHGNLAYCSQHMVRLTWKSKSQPRELSP